MKFRFYIADTFNGSIKGTDDIEKAVEFSECDEFYVLDAETGESIVSGERREIKE
jgi:hypothetical protein